MRFFNDCSTIDEVRNLYKKLAMQHHPDRGGDTATMQEINTEYAFASAKILQGGNHSAERQEEEMRFTEQYAEVISKIITLPDIEIELCGLWLWVSGNTRAVKDQLKDAGFFWASKKEMWYYRSEDYKGVRGGKKTIEEIRSKYGSEKIKSQRHRFIDK